MAELAHPPGPLQRPATWDAVASGYGEEVARMGVFAERAIALAELPPTARVLDVAAGTGALSLRAAARVASVVAVDFAPAMIAELQAGAARAKLGNVETLVCDAAALQLPEQSFDAAFCMFGFMFFPDRGAVFASLRRLLREGGVAVIATWAEIARRPLMKVGFDALAEAIPGMPAPSKGDLQTPEECIAEMRDAGFRDVTTERVTGSARYDSAEHYMALQEGASAPLQLMKSRLGEPAWSEARARVVTALARAIPEGGAELSAEALLTLGRR